jgi:serine/threonine protein kinase
MNVELGEKIGKYQLVESLGRGAMAEVYKAYHPSLDRYVAIKVLHAFLSEKTDILNRFQREAKHIAALSHVNIVQVYDFDAVGTLYYMVMEFIDGPSLKKLMKDKQTEGQLMPVEEVIWIVTGVGRALAFAHTQGVVHRDIKPANIMIDKKERVVLTDFGLAKIVSGPQFTTTGALVGTPAYMSPEQGLGQQGDARSDLYSLGGVFYQMVTGRFPFSAETPIATVFKHINAPLPSPRTVNPDLSDDLEKIILKLMAKSPDERYQKAEEMLEDLEAMKSTDTSGLVGNIPSQPSIVQEMALALHVVETGQILALEGASEFTLGRIDGAARPDIDLSSYGAYRQGVSRLHASINLGEDQTISIVDLGSTNGARVNGEKISPHLPVVVQNGDFISLGKFALQVLIR